jgi:heat shock protein HslJ
MFSKFCNTVSVGYMYSGGALLASGVGMSTMMYCEGLPMVLETAFQINDSAAVMMSGSILTITTSGNNVFIFEKQTPTICTLEYMPVC